MESPSTGSSYYLFDLIFEYAKHAIIKANTANQALLTYRMAYLKAHYPELPTYISFGVQAWLPGLMPVKKTNIDL